MTRSNLCQFRLLAALAWFFLLFSGIAWAGPYLNDNFNDNSLNTTLWSITNFDGVTVAEANERLEVAIPGTATGNPFWGGVTSYDAASHNYFFIKEGSEFEVSVDFKLVDWPRPANGIRMALKVFIEVDPVNNKWHEYTAGRMSDPGYVVADTKYCEQFPNKALCTGDVLLPYTSHYASAKSGTLIIRRTRGIDGSAWILQQIVLPGETTGAPVLTADWGKTVVQLVAWGHDWKFSKQAVKVTFDNLKIKTEKGFIFPPGDLQVIIKPQKAIDAGAEWRVDGGDWQPSGALIAGLAVGSGDKHVVSFKETTHWAAPEDREVVVISNKTRTITATYIERGSLIVNISPDEAVMAGARWRVDDGAWKKSGAKVQNLDAGDHTVSFNSVTGWTEPPAQTILIESGKTKKITRTYVKLAESALPADEVAEDSTAE